MGKRGMRMAKADKDDIETTRTFLQAIDEITKSGFDLDEWKCDVGDENYEWYQLLKSLVKKDSFSDYEIDFERLSWYFQQNVSYKYTRVVAAADILIDNVCDPALDYLEYKPELKDSVPRDKAKKLITWALKRK